MRYLVELTQTKKCFLYVDAVDEGEATAFAFDVAYEQLYEAYSDGYEISVQEVEEDEKLMTWTDIWTGTGWDNTKDCK